jgi:hypothetical protein
MVMRAVLAVLTLLGAVPFRVCTCGAAHVHHKAPVAPAEHPTHSGCSGHQTNDSLPDHDHDCPAVKPSAAMSVALTATVAELPPDCPLVFASDVGNSVLTLAATPAHAEPRSPDPPPDQPLYLTLRTLRN